MKRFITLILILILILCMNHTCVFASVASDLTHKEKIKIAKDFCLKQNYDFAKINNLDEFVEELSNLRSKYSGLYIYGWGADKIYSHLLEYRESSDESKREKYNFIMQNISAGASAGVIQCLMEADSIEEAQRAVNLGYIPWKNHGKYETFLYVYDSLTNEEGVYSEQEKLLVANTLINADIAVINNIFSVANSVPEANKIDLILDLYCFETTIDHNRLGDISQLQRLLEIENPYKLEDENRYYSFEILKEIFTNTPELLTCYNAYYVNRDVNKYTYDFFIKYYRDEKINNTTLLGFIRHVKFNSDLSVEFASLFDNINFNKFGLLESEVYEFPNDFVSYLELHKLMVDSNVFNDKQMNIIFGLDLTLESKKEIVSKIIKQSKKTNLENSDEIISMTIDEYIEKYRYNAYLKEHVSYYMLGMPTMSFCAVASLCFGPLAFEPMVDGYKKLDFSRPITYVYPGTYVASLSMLIACINPFILLEGVIEN